MNAGRDAETGVVLINVLAVVALASAVVITMLTLADGAIRRSQRFSDAAQASAYALGAEASAVVALRRDAEEAGDVDHYGEAWGKVAQEAVAIEGGRFAVAIEDAQSKFNVNGLRDGGVLALQTFRRIAVAQDLPENTGERALALIRFAGPLRSIDDLRAIGLDDDGLARLSEVVTALPGKADINANTASEALLATLMNNPVSASFLVSRRDRAGFLSREELAQAGIVLPPGLVLRSDFFRVTVDVTVGVTGQRLVSLLQRRERGGRAEVVAVERKREGAAPIERRP